MGELVMDLRHLSVVHRGNMFYIKFSNPSSLCSSWYCGAEKIEQRLKNQILGIHSVITFRFIVITLSCS